MIKYCLLLTLFLMSSGCTTKYYSGYIFNNADHERIKVLKSTMIEVQKIMGSPTFVDKLDRDTVWYYSSGIDHYFLFMTNKLVKKKILRITFDEKSIAQKKEWIVNDY